MTIDENNWWFFRVGYGSTVLRCKDGKLRHTVDNATLVGVTGSDFERGGQWKKTSDGMVQPKHIRKYILENT